MTHMIFHRCRRTEIRSGWTSGTDPMTRWRLRDRRSCDENSVARRGKWIDAATFVLLGFAIGRGAWLPVAIVLVVANVAYIVFHRWRGRLGLDQWPHPFGPYYREWLSLPDAGDYYEWLAGRMGQRQPWKAWARIAGRDKRTLRDNDATAVNE